MADFKTEFDVGERGWFHPFNDERYTLEGEVRAIKINSNERRTSVEYSVLAGLGEKPEIWCVTDLRKVK